MVRILNSGVTGKITNINDVTKEYSILTDENDTIEVTVNQIVDVKDDVTQNLTDIENKARQVDGELKAQNFNVIESETPKGEDDNTGYGVKDNFKADDDSKDKKPINQEATFNKEDRTILNDISSKLATNINALDDLSKKLETYDKINKNPINDIIAKIKSFKESIDNELQSI